MKLKTRILLAISILVLPANALADWPIYGEDGELIACVDSKGELFRPDKERKCEGTGYELTCSGSFQTLYLSDGEYLGCLDCLLGEVFSADQFPEAGCSDEGLFDHSKPLFEWRWEPIRPRYDVELPILVDQFGNPIPRPAKNSQPYLHQ